ncbi:ThuA domain-containing protein [Streptomyces corynorhini]|uniref:ThuA domain-containing protein n=1 Tax=Streptomyces corynorhini TaxID=2282652 RepID=A0A370AYG0_9ACTN|nr:ThuA domain-containing protein [Streptomyces corynorhini]RDG34628.1 ThuA domain-containing protein [Streptomyces corynorhini]
MSPRPPRLVLYTRTTAYRHESIPAGVEAVERLAAEEEFAALATEDPAALEHALGSCAVVVFLSTSGEVLTPGARAALRAHMAGGGGFVGIHAAACTEYDWPYYGELLGARFARHPALQPGTVTVTDRAHPATRHLDARWHFTDEWYDFRAAPEGVRVLAGADESSYDGGGMGPAHPLVWCHERMGGPVFYTALGHTAESFADPAFLAHLRGGIRYAAGRG